MIIKENSEVELKTLNEIERYRKMTELLHHTRQLQLLKARPEIFIKEKGLSL